ncbi:hypothetical protein CLOM_g1504 [Closterium sp. NIES-68]|nr:hypothetical protein CLOM_g1504 [Closterium sp. NIES-68]GJP61797.1 hypothetical protein CLOP_g18924 [Closterium sp. NIES-67]
MEGDGRRVGASEVAASEVAASDVAVDAAAGDAVVEGAREAREWGERGGGKRASAAKEWKMGGLEVGDMGERGGLEVGDMGERGGLEVGDMGERGGLEVGDMGERGGLEVGDMGERGGLEAGEVGAVEAQGERLGAEGGKEAGGERNARGVAEGAVQQGGAEGGERNGRGAAEGAFHEGRLDVRGWDDVFFADVGVTWQDLGLQQEVGEAMGRAGFERPSAIQAGAVPQILSGSDVVVAAETGSGKTHAYLAPLLSHVLTWREEERQRELAEEESEGRSEELREGRSEGGLGEEGEERRRKRRVGARKFALVLCPNAALCRQVMEMALSLRSSDNRPLLAVEAVVGGQGWPTSPPDLVVATPAALFNHLFAFDPKQRRRSAFVRDVALVVVDEADMLLGGGYARIVGRLLGLFRLDEKERSEAARLAGGSATLAGGAARLAGRSARLAQGDAARVAGEEGEEEGEEVHWTEVVPVVVSQGMAGVRQGLESGEEAQGGGVDLGSSGAAAGNLSSASDAYNPKKSEEEGGEEGDGYGVADREWSEGVEGEKQGGDRALLDAAVRLGEREREGDRAAGRAGKVVVSVRENEREEERRRGKWGRRRREYERSKRYVFVAATMPTGTKKSVGEVLARQFPEAVWVSGGLLHRHNPFVRHEWQQVGDDSRATVLLAALTSRASNQSDNQRPDGDQPESIQRSMVFANDVESVDAIGRLLQRHLSSSAAATSERAAADDGVRGGAADVAAGEVADVAWCAVYHKDVPLDERERALRRFQERGGVLVCTDAASRGIDVEHVSHVVQAEFALNTVDFLHRVGRTGRAGRPGRVTSLYTAGSAPLAEAVREAVQKGESTESAFSRKRSFRKKLKKYGGRD